MKKITHETIAVAGTSVYHTYPDDGAAHPGLIVIEEIWGVNDHIKAVADRFAREGYHVLSPELLPEGLLATLTPELQTDLFDPAKRDDAQPKLRAAMQPIMQPEYAAATIKKLTACVDFLVGQPGVDGAVGVLGFCFGGSYSFHLAAHDPRIRVAVPFYGQPPQDAEIPGITCPILALYGDHDTHLMESLPHLKNEMTQQQKKFESVVYQNAGHAFFNDTNARMYREDAAADAWQKTIAFLEKNLAQ